MATPLMPLSPPCPTPSHIQPSTSEEALSSVMVIRVRRGEKGNKKSSIAHCQAAIGASCSPSKRNKRCALIYHLGSNQNKRHRAWLQLCIPL